MIVFVLAYQIIFRKGNEYDTNIYADHLAHRSGIKTEGELREQYKDA